MKRLITFVLLFAIASNINAGRSASAPDALIGTWLNPPGNRKVEFYKDSDQYFGKLAWISVDDETLGKVGTVVFKDMRWNGQAFVGTAVTPTQGEVACSISFDTDLKLKITFTKGIFSKSLVWTRA